MTRIPISLENQKGLQVSHDGKTVRGDLVDAVLQRADEVREENSARVAQNDRTEQERDACVAEAERKRLATSPHERAMDAKAQLARQLRDSGMAPRAAEEAARQATERAN